MPTVIAFVTVVSFWVRPPGLELVRHIAGWGVVSCAVSLLLGVALPAYGLMPTVSGDQSDKAIVGGTLLSGMFNHSNTLGAVAALTLPLVFLFRRRMTVFLSIIFTFCALIWSASRTSMIAAIAMAFAWFVVRLFRRSNRVSVAVVSFVLIASLLLVAITPFVTDDPTAFTSRGQIWIFSRGAFEAAPIFGNGVSFFQDIWAVNNGLFKDAQHAHNSFLTQLTTLGLVGGVGLFLLVFMCARVSLAYARIGDLRLSMYVVVWLVLSIGETVWRFNVTQPMWLFGTLPLIVLAASGVPRWIPSQAEDGQLRQARPRPSWYQRGAPLVSSDSVAHR
ncbi:O-antigen ligase family protein [Microbacterium dextranolyticum]|uniref:O-antigen ligase family protein n=1 Tax=Microbacterium dextranolyticum TaxID=36806 RepID=UPI001959597C|nr:O-antigen ligase family protein [Microbacterium dextranolyticum]MBM7462086.1 O-antigen ligase [Microbacterium dextranolyticum]